MVSTLLKKARDYETLHGAEIPEDQRPVFHVTPAVGWMNDPNGFSFYKGACHLFYQYHPYSNEWGPMHWGHVTSRDFLHWERLPAALAPDTPHDEAGCFSGGAVELPDGRQMLMYTGVRRVREDDGAEHDIQAQCVAFGDGLNYEKADLNPVLAGQDLPEGGSVVDFRDPKVWREDDGTLYAVVGNRTADGSGAVLLYRSRYGLKWEFVRTLDASRNEFGRMWECPDFFCLDGRHVLVTSPQDMAPPSPEFHAGNNTMAMTGAFDARGFHRQSVQTLDFGLDFYAPQTLLTPDGRRVMIAWMQNWSTAGAKPDPCRWFGQMTLPRELFFRDGRLCQRPVRELDGCRARPVTHRDVSVSGKVELPGVRGRVLDMTVTLRPDGESAFNWFDIHLASGSGYGTRLRYRPGENTLEIDRSRSGMAQDIVHTRLIPVRDRGGEITLRLVLDRFSVELFINDGEQTAAAVIYTPQESDAIVFDAGGRARMDVEKYDLAL